MKLSNEAITGLRKQIKEHKDCIKDLLAEIASIEKDFGKTEHPLLVIIRKHPRLRTLKPPTEEQCETLYTLYGEAKVVETTENMNNWETITKNHYFNATITNWLKRDVMKAIEKAKPTGRVIKDDMPVMITGEKLSENRDKIKSGWLTKDLRSKK